jgi:hypothetical protein
MLTYNAEPTPFVAPIVDYIEHAGKNVSLEHPPPLAVIDI